MPWRASDESTDPATHYPSAPQPSRVQFWRIASQSCARRLFAFGVSVPIRQTGLPDRPDFVAFRPAASDKYPRTRLDKTPPRQVDS